MGVVYLKVFTCERCGVEFTKKARWCKYCPICRRRVDVEKVIKSRKIRYPETRVGVGSGGAQFGKANHMAKEHDPSTEYSGFGYWYRWLRAIMIRCGICGSRDNLQIHHIDGDRRNMGLRNLRVVCGKCHTRIHHGGRL